MIIGGVIRLLLGLLTPILTLVPDVTFTPQPIESFMQYVRAILYFFPMGTVTIIFTLFITLQIIRIVIAFINLFKNILFRW